MQQENCIYL